MSINNLNTHQPIAFSLAAMCLKSLSHGGLDNECEKVRKEDGARSREWFDLDGNKLNDDEFLMLIGENLKRAKKLYANYEGDCKLIINRNSNGSMEPGKVRKGTKYFDRDGIHTSQKTIAKIEHIAYRELKRFFDGSSDYVEAYKLIDAYKETRKCRK